MLSLYSSRYFIIIKYSIKEQEILFFSRFLLEFYSIQSLSASFPVKVYTGNKYFYKVNQKLR